MATLVLQGAGAAVGGLLGGPVGAFAGRALGGLAGSIIDGQLLGALTPRKNVVGPRLKTLDGVASSEGAPIPRVYGRARVGGQVIWATRLLEVASRTRVKSASGKGGPSATSTSYANYANFAVGLCEGPIAFVRRVWADGKEIDLTTITMRAYVGDESQGPDALILAIEGSAPAYRGLAYVVFERLPLAPYGNRLPQLTFEVVGPVAGLAPMIRGVDLIPGASEFAYAPQAVTSLLEPGVTRSENRHQLTHASDWIASLDALQALCPNLSSVALVVAWFGDDLRAGRCRIEPKVEVTAKLIFGADWSVAGISRAQARPVSLSDGSPAYGGTPSDDAVIAAVRDLKARGLSVVFYPFVMMDVPAGNSLPNPWTGGAGQPPYPWRGRITCDPAPGQPGSPDATAAAGAQIASFFGSAAPPDSEFSFRRFVLHCADLCVAAGGVDAFLIGSELVALTRVRSASGTYPAANALAALAGDVKAVLGAGAKISYAADWTEYGAHVLEGGAEVRFPLDVVWSAPAVDFIGVDVYWPLSDWRDGATHLDASEAASVYDRAYLARRVASGEGYDWFYADAGARDAQNRTPIADGAYNKPWIFRQKDLVGFWSNPHFERVGAVEHAAPTAWAPASKPIWITELGCPAVDRGANAPNVFPDPKSSESAIPPFSRGGRDDLMQNRFLEAVLSHFDPASPAFVATNNPVSPVYGGRMVDVSRLHLWAWDARPFPAFPDQSTVWSDAGDWEAGHWLTGRLEGAPLDDLVAAILRETPDVICQTPRPALDGFVDGYVLDRTLSARGAIEPLGALFGFDAIIAAGAIGFAGRSGRSTLTLGPDDLAPDKDGKLVALTRAEESELPHELSVTFGDSEHNYRPATALSRRLAGFSRREAQSELAVMLRRNEMQRLADIWLGDLWVARETAEFALRPGLIALQIGDAVSVPVGAANRLFRIERINDADARAVFARRIEPSVYDRQAGASLRAPAPSPKLPGPARALILDLAFAREDPTPLNYLAIAADPWPGAVAVWRSIGSAAFELLKTVPYPALIGDTQNAFEPGPAGRFDLASRLILRINSGALASVSDAELLAGKTLMAIRGPDGAWEMFGFGVAELIGERVYALSRLIRGMGGEEALSQRSVPAGAPVVLLDDALTPLGAGLSELGLAHVYRIGPADRDIADPAFIEIAATGGPKAYQPYAPAQASATRGASGVAIAFTRRGRRDADGWEPVDIPLGEDSENYLIEIWRADALLRTLAVASPSALDAAGDELADFGEPQAALSLRIYQISASVGRGFPLVADVPVN